MQTLTNQKNNEETIWMPINPNVSNAALQIWNSSNKLIRTSFKIIENSSQLINISTSLNYTDTFYWNYLAIDNSSNKAYASSNFTIIYNTNVSQNENFTYDNNGNLISGLDKNYTYDSFNQLSEIRNSTNNQLIARYSYDHEGNRIKQVEYNIDSNKNNRTTYYISDNFIQVRITNGTIYNETYYYANDKLIAKKDNSGRKTYYHGDHLGSTTLVTNQTGSIVEEEFYLPHGDTYSGPESNRFLFTAKELDKLTDLYYYGARYYQASIMRMFIQPDSIIPDIYNPQSLNRYSYVLNNPYKYVDTTGHYIETALDIGFIAYDIYSIIQDPSNSANYVALGADIGGAILPGVTGLGVATRLAKGVDKVGDVVDVAKIGEKAGDASKADKIKDIKFENLHTETQDTINKIQQGKTDGLRPHEFKNKEGILPKQEPGYYTTHDVTNSKNPERIVTGKNGERYYTDKHYEKGSFTKVIDKIKDILGGSKKK